MARTSPKPPAPAAGLFIAALIASAALSSCLSVLWNNAEPNDKTDRAVFQSLSEVFNQFRSSSGKIWSEDYRLDRMPILLVRKENGRDLYGFLINHPTPEELGGTVQDIPADLKLPPIYLLKTLPSKRELAEIRYFTFSIDLGGTGTFLLKYSADDFWGFGNKFTAADIEFHAEQWALYLVHEAFHTFQLELERWNWRVDTQDTAGYPLDEMHLALIMLETAALRSAVSARSEEARRKNTQMFIAVREQRMEQYTKAADLDLSQEQTEGSAKYVEHQIGSLLGFKSTNLETFANEDSLMPMPESRIRSHAAFDRFYGTGAAQCRLLDQFEAEDWKNRISGGLAPYEVLRDYFALDDSQLADFFSLAEDTFGFSEIRRRAEKAAARAAEEPKDIWGSSSF